MNFVEEWEYKQAFNLFHEWMKEYVRVEFDDYVFGGIWTIPNGINGSCYRVVLKDDENRSYSLYWPLVQCEKEEV